MTFLKFTEDEEDVVYVFSRLPKHISFFKNNFTRSDSDIVLENISYFPKKLMIPW